MTVSISAKSTPRAATSVHSRTAGVRCEDGKLMNEAKAISRTRGGKSPCSEVNAKLASSGRRDRICSSVYAKEVTEYSGSLDRSNPLRRRWRSRQCILLILVVELLVEAVV
jgi:hypothetical protein